MITTLNAAPADSANLFCINCGYNQRGITSGHCPECGQDFSKLPPSPARLPWLHRRHLGLLRAYWRTAGIVIFHKKDFCQQIDTPIPLRDAKIFWLLTIVQAWLPIAAGVLVLILLAPRTGPWHDLREIILQTVFLPIPLSVFFLIGLLLFFAVATGMPSYFCHPHSLALEQQNRAIALSYFASAPIAFMPLVILLLILAGVTRAFSTLQLFLQGAFALLTLLVFALWYTRTVGIVLTLSQRPRRNLTALFLTVGWFAAIGLCLIFIPATLLYAAALLYSMF